MGYTHYWYLKQGIKEIPKECLRDIHLVLRKYKVLIQYESDNKKPPIATKTLIRFNGIGENGHETFVFTLEKDKNDFLQKDKDDFVFSFCKTANKSYDIVVCEVLLILKGHLQDSLKLSSDGFSNSECSFDGEWNKAIEEVKRMNYKINCCVFSRNEGESLYYNCEIKSIEINGFYEMGDWKNKGNN
jgi:hypothetical protein